MTPIKYDMNIEQGETPIGYINLSEKLEQMLINEDVIIAPTFHRDEVGNITIIEFSIIPNIRMDLLGSDGDE